MNKSLTPISICSQLFPDNIFFTLFTAAFSKAFYAYHSVNPSLKRVLIDTQLEKLGFSDRGNGKMLDLTTKLLLAPNLNIGIHPSNKFK